MKLNKFKKIKESANKKIKISIIFGILFCIILYSFYLSKKKNLKKDTKQFESVISQLKNKSQKSFINAQKFAEKEKNIYGALINLKLAKIAVEQNKIHLAEKILYDTSKIKITKNIQDLINIRLARVQLSLNKTKESITTLKKVKNENWNPIVEQIKGDAFLKQGNKTSAKIAYFKGMELSKSEILKKMLKSKIENIKN